MPAICGICHRILCGDYHAALVANARALEADRKYPEREGVVRLRPAPP
jgi:hypothetical protein